MVGIDVFHMAVKSPANTAPHLQKKLLHTPKLITGDLPHNQLPRASDSITTKILLKHRPKKKNKINSSTSNRLRLLWMFQSDILPNMVRTKASYLVTEHNDKQCLFFWSSSRQLWISLLPIIHQIWCLCCKNVTKFITAWGYENDKYYCSFYNGIFIITEGGSNHIQCQGFQTLSQMN